MKLHLCCVYDRKAEQFLPPFCAPTLGVAERMLLDILRDPQSDLNKHPEDYLVFSVGEFDNQTGYIEGLGTCAQIVDGTLQSRLDGACRLEHRQVMRVIDFVSAGSSLPTTKAVGADTTLQLPLNATKQ